ncbi:unnamed protein product [Heligmosomoides polygyrus]|uniref:Uncharacterized protein n=1 Tax=Heligmosomoides polygyrus TaxID=6339 RepID=A0A183FUT4_HELPZ|nr:unnamed protein product [Heligmosomoides polygyrus]
MCEKYGTCSAIFPTGRPAQKKEWTSRMTNVREVRKVLGDLSNGRTSTEERMDITNGELRRRIPDKLDANEASEPFQITAATATTVQPLIGQRSAPRSRPHLARLDETHSVEPGQESFHIMTLMQSNACASLGCSEEIDRKVSMNLYDALVGSTDQLFSMMKLYWISWETIIWMVGQRVFSYRCLGA